jgi:uncharacterized protein (DUF433 family)
MRVAGRIFRILKESEMAYRIPRARGQRLRDYPTYTIPEAALFLGMSTRTLQRWILEKPLWTISGARYSVPLLSFQDIAQVYYVELIRSHFHLSMGKARELLAASRTESRAQYPLLTGHLRRFFKHIILTKPARGKQPRRDIDLSHHRQLTIPQVVDLFGSRVQRVGADVTKLYPWRYWIPGTREETPVTLDPEVMSGRLVVTGTRIPVQVLLSRKKAGEPISEIASDYDLSENEINLAISHILPLERPSVSVS